MSQRNVLRIPKKLKLGFASASYQIEGAAHTDGKGENIWDRFTNSAISSVKDKSNGDVAANSYYLYKDDVALIKKMNGEVYRFSISWSRLLPSGFSNKVNPLGLSYYNNLIDELMDNGIEPIVTLYHWDLPQPLQDLGGWTNASIIDYFADYARVVFKNFGNRVKMWITINEPWEACYLGYGAGVFAPGIRGNGIAEYLAGHNLLKAHAKAYHVYDEEFRSQQNGVIGICFNTMGLEPKTDSEADKTAARRFFDFHVGWFANPIFSAKGDYPDSMKTIIAEKSRNEGFPRSRLPEFDAFWINYICGTSDFYGMNHYTSQQISSNCLQDAASSWQNDVPATSSQPDSWPATASFWFRVYPEGFRRALNFIHKEYNAPLIYVTENGYSDRGEVEDDNRISFYNSYMKEMLKAIHLDGVNVELYTAWSLLDDFEWTAGYTERFGITSVDFDDPERKRVPKKSAEFFERIIRTRQLDP